MRGGLLVLGLRLRWVCYWEVGGIVLVDSGWHSRKISPPRACAAAKLVKMPAVARRTLWMNMFIQEDLMVLDVRLLKESWLNL